MASTKRPFRAASTDVELFLGLMSARGDLAKVQKPGGKKETEFKLACPESGSMTDMDVVKQKYECEIHGVVGAASDCLRAKEIDGCLVYVTEEEIAEVKASEFPKKQAAIQVYPRDDVESQTYPTGETYVFVPKSNEDLVAALIQKLEDPGFEFALVFELNLRSQKLMRLQAWEGNLVFQELVRPEDLVSFDPLKRAFEAKHVAMLEVLLQTMSADFDPAAHENQARQRIALLVEAKAGGDVTVPVRSVSATPVKKVDDLEALLAASIAAAQSSKSA